MKLTIATAERVNDPIAVAAGQRFSSRADEVPCGACGLPMHRDRGRTASGAIRAGVVLVNGSPVCGVAFGRPDGSCADLAAASNVAALRGRLRQRDATWSAVSALWSAREARAS